MILFDLCQARSVRILPFAFKICLVDDFGHFTSQKNLERRWFPHIHIYIYMYTYIYIYGVHCGEVAVQNKITVYNKGTRWKFEPFCRLISVKVAIYNLSLCQWKARSCLFHTKVWWQNPNPVWKPAKTTLRMLWFEWCQTECQNGCEFWNHERKILHETHITGGDDSAGPFAG